MLIFIHSFNRLLLSTSFVPVTVLGAENTMVNKTFEIPDFRDFTF